MHKRLRGSTVLATLATVLFLCFLASLRELRHPVQAFQVDRLIDFDVYYIAGALVRQGLDADIYDDAATGVDPQTRYADPSTPFAQEAARHGIERTQLYVYPPFLADAVAPFSLLPLPAAARMWQVLNAAALLVVALLAARLFAYPLLSVRSLIILAALLTFRPVWICMFFGQVTIFLLLLWTLALLLYRLGHIRLSAIVLAVAVAIKLTPILLLVPLLIWRDWRWVRWLAGSLASLALLASWKNGPHTLALFALHVAPAMSGGKPSLDNKTVSSAVQMMGAWVGALRHSSTPRYTVQIGKLLSAILVVIAAMQTIRLGGRLSPSLRLAVLASFCLLSICVAPVSWQHAYAVAFLPLAVLWQGAVEEGAGPTRLILLAASTIAIGSISFTSIGRAMGPPYLAAYLAPFTGILLCLHVLFTSAAPRELASAC